MFDKKQWEQNGTFFGKPHDELKGDVSNNRSGINMEEPWGLFGSFDYNIYMLEWRKTFSLIKF